MVVDLEIRLEVLVVRFENLVASHLGVLAAVAVVRLKTEIAIWIHVNLAFHFDCWVVFEGLCQLRLTDSTDSGRTDCEEIDLSENHLVVQIHHCRLDVHSNGDN